MVSLLDEAGIAHTGAGRNLEEARRPAVILSRRGIRIGLVAFTDDMAEWQATVTRPGINHLPARTDGLSLLCLKDSIQEARERDADPVVVSAHWGPNIVRLPPPHFCAFARGVLDAGADIWHGHSAHLFQGIELYGDKPIMYDTGDFVDDYAVNPVERNDQSFIFYVKLIDGKIDRLELVPTIVGECQVNIAKGRQAQGILRRMERLCALMGTETKIVDKRLVIKVR